VPDLAIRKSRLLFVNSITVTSPGIVDDTKLLQVEGYSFQFDGGCVT